MPDAESINRRKITTAVQRYHRTHGLRAQPWCKPPGNAYFSLNCDVVRHAESHPLPWRRAHHVDESERDPLTWNVLGLYASGRGATCCGWGCSDYWDRKQGETMLAALPTARPRGSLICCEGFLFCTDGRVRLSDGEVVNVWERRLAGEDPAAMAERLATLMDCSSWPALCTGSREMAWSVVAWWSRWCIRRGVDMDGATKQVRAGLPVSEKARWAPARHAAGALTLPDRHPVEMRSGKVIGAREGPNAARGERVPGVAPRRARRFAPGLRGDGRTPGAARSGGCCA